MQVGWCENCNVPIIDVRNCGLCGSTTKRLRIGEGELKPIFKPEKKSIEKIIEASLGKEYTSKIPKGLCFYSKMGEIIIDGEKMFRIIFDKDSRTYRARLFKHFLENETNLYGSDLQKIINANKYILEEMEQQSLSFLETSIKKMSDLPVAVSFSGGKDSTLILALSRKIERVKSELDVIYLNTTIEFEETTEYVHGLAKKWKLNLIEITPPHNFFELCEKLGPPSRFMKWCCKTQKFAPMNKLINERYPNGVLVISGLRAAESRNRKNFQKIQCNKLIPKQTLISPIYEWGSLAVWLYLLWKKIPFNELYRRGFFRLGCWACPERSLKQLKLVEEIHPDLMNKFHQMLRNFASKEKLTNVEGWIRDAKWQVRVSRYKYDFVCLTRYCTLSEEYIYWVSDKSSMGQVEEFMKVFGKVEKRENVMRITNAVMQISIDKNWLRVKLNSDSETALPLFERQLEKALNCIHCGACLGTCKKGALHIENGRTVVSESCVHCLECIKPKGMRKGCISLNYGSNLLSINNPLV